MDGSPSRSPPPRHYDGLTDNHVSLSPDERFRAAREAIVDRVAAYTREDIAILEKLQAGRLSSGYDGGRFSPIHETTTHRFQTMIARALLGPPRDAAQPVLRTSHR